MLLAHVISRENITRIVELENHLLTEEENLLYQPANTGNIQKNASQLRGKSLQHYLTQLYISRKALIGALEQLTLKSMMEEVGSSQIKGWYNKLGLCNR